ncbi:MAG: ATP-binding protein [Gemmatimonadota bacterium]|nr:ATP-binding protein [Gemmatimonadota bacterium]MDH5196732.1 ATP-binding protein [Gemmatimonadota bacterium]
MPETPAARTALAVLADVASYLSASLGVEEVLAGVATALKRGIGAQACCVWMRGRDDATFRPIRALGDRAKDLHDEPQIAAITGLPEPPPWRPDEPYLVAPLTYQGERLGLLECRVADTPDRVVWTEVTRTVANILAPLLSTITLSEDLAGQVALRTREIDAQRRLTSRIIDSLPVGLYVIDRDYRIQAWNRKRETGTQGVARDTALGRPVFDVLHRQPRDLIKEEFDRVFATGGIEEMEIQTEGPAGPRYYRLSKIPMRLDDQQVTHVITIGEDITQSKLGQQQIAQTEKLAAVGQLAAGVMHEINNPLATIGACVEALNSRLDELPLAPQAAVAEYLEIIQSELTRCKSIVDGLLDFSRPKARAKYPVPINQVVEDALFLLRYHDRFKRIDVKRRLTEDLPPVEANSEQLVQAFLDLMLNAIDAMDGRGTLTVSTRRHRSSGEEVVVEIRDTGMGIPREDIGKIFEPFFTTKAPGQGTGLGLSITYAIVEHHRGRILVDSQLGSGSTFRVILPVFVPEAVA